MSFRIEHEARDPWQAPANQSVARGSPSDIATAVLECMVNSRGAQNDNARANAERAHELLEHAREQLRQAMERADQAEESGGVWGDIGRFFGSDIASIAGLVAAVSLAVATGGAGTPAVLALIAAGLTVGAKAGDELHLDPRITAVLGATGGVLGLVAGNVTSAGSAWTTVATTIAQGASAVQGGASGLAGGATVVEGQYRSEALDHRAEAMAAQSRQHDAWLRLDLAIEMLDRACREVSHATERASDIVQDNSDGRTAVISRIGAA